MARAYIGLGTNIGDRKRSLERAIAELQRLGRVTGISSVYESEPIGYTDQPDFWNLAARLETSHPPDGLLAELTAAEARVGRTPTFRNGPRVIDLDLLLYDDLVRTTNALELPHPRWLERSFVIQPLLELDPELVDPRSGRPLREFMPAAVPKRIERLFDGRELARRAGVVE